MKREGAQGGGRTWGIAEERSNAGHEALGALLWNHRIPHVGRNPLTSLSPTLGSTQKRGTTRKKNTEVGVFFPSDSYFSVTTFCCSYADRCSE